MRSRATIFSAGNSRRRIQGTYGLLEQNINLLFQNPHFLGNRDVGLTFSGGYANSQDVTTYVASKLETGVRWTEHFTKPGSCLSKANTFVYEFDFRRVKVSEGSLQVGPSAIQALSTAVRVAGPSLTWIRDTRDSPLDSHRGTYSSFQDFLSNETFGAQAEFNRLDVSNSSYYGFDKNRFVLARNTRYGQERAYGSPSAASASSAGTVVCRRSHLASRILDQRGGTARSGDGVSNRRRGRAVEQHGIAAAAADAALLRRLR